MLAVDNPFSNVSNSTQNTPVVAQQNVQQSALGPAVDRNAVRRSQANDSFSFSDNARRLAGQRDQEQSGLPGQDETSEAPQGFQGFNRPDPAPELNPQAAQAQSQQGEAEAEGEEQGEAEATEKPKSDGTELTESEKEQVTKLKARDLEVRTHEQAHLSVAGSLANGGPSYSYQTGPDGRRYAVGGEVSIDNSAVSGDPQATIQKMTRVKAAALAPAEPSSQDRKVASDAERKKAQAQQELSQQALEQAPQAEAAQAAPAEAEQSNAAPAPTSVASDNNQNQGPNASSNGNNGQPNNAARSPLNGTYGASGAAANRLEQNIGLSIVA